ncbi:MAG: potassium transporter inner membrane associated protein [marine bacterium B5-7]|nr:MAG: potassium transporter inner membrane associated protein [marine bacterium B5-7]
MKIIILGAGQVGGTLATYLVNEENDVTVVDSDPARLSELQNRLDIGTVVGSGSYPNVLRQAGAETADMLVAVTSSDEINIVACQVSYTLFRTPVKIARIRSRHYQAYKELFADEAMPVDIWISPEGLVTNYLKKLIDMPGALQVLDFAGGKVQIVSVKPNLDGELVGKTIKTLRGELPGIDARVVAIFRGNHLLPLTGKTLIQPGDEVFYVTATAGVSKVMAGMGRGNQSNKRVMIAGGGNIGTSLAKAIEDSYNVRLIESEAKRAQHLIEELNNTTILVGDVADRSLLSNENIEYTDVFVAVTNNDETNVMACLQAKRMGARTAIALVAKTAYVELLETSSEIDIVIAPQTITISGILKLLRRGDIVNVHALRHGAAEAIEVIAHGDSETSKVVGREIGELDLPPGTQMGAILRGEEVIIPHRDTPIASEDHVVIFLADKKHIPKVERLFQVGPAFI